MTELTLWDYVTLGVTLIVITVYVVRRVMRALDNKNGQSCVGCSKGSCTSSTKVEFDGSTHCEKKE